MEILRAEEMGFCVGVRRAIRIMEEAAQEKGRIQSLGGIVHNRQVVEDLAAKGVTVADGLEGLTGDAVAITSHGIGLRVVEELQKRGLEIIDSTCPFVRKAQKAAKALVEAGFTVVIFGDADHPEVRGILGWAGEKGIVATSWHDIASLKPLPRKLGILSQTTQSTAKFAEFVKSVIDSHLGRMIELRVVNTICDATSKRQAAALALAGKVDCMLVVGGRNSANTRRLVEICAMVGVRTYHIETATEIDPNWLVDCRRVGVTAGASTPDQVIDEVIQTLQRIDTDASTEPALSHSE